MKQSALKRRAARALERQLDYQRSKAATFRGREPEIVARMAERSARVRAQLSAVKPIPTDARVLEVGSGSQGLIFFFEAGEKVGVDPLADEYRKLFPWHADVPTLATFGEELPFEDTSFDVVLSDNVVDHAENPRRIVEELVRVLKPGGLLYFTVNVHHPIYHFAATLHAAWRALGIRFEITPFADHTVHLTPGAARSLLRGLQLRIVQESDAIAEAKRSGRKSRRRHPGDLAKVLFFKNARWEVIAVKDGQLA